MYKIRTPFNYVKTQVEHNPLPSLTIPDQSLSIKQIIERFTRGLGINVKSYEPVYNGPNTIPDLKTLDLAEQQLLREFYRDQVKEHNEKIEKEIKQRRMEEQREFNEWKKKRDEDLAKSQNPGNPATNDQPISS